MRQTKSNIRKNDPPSTSTTQPADPSSKRSTAQQRLLAARQKSVASNVSSTSKSKQAAPPKPSLRQKFTNSLKSMIKSDPMKIGAPKKGTTVETRAGGKAEEIGKEEEKEEQEGEEDGEKWCWECVKWVIWWCEENSD